MKKYLRLILGGLVIMSVITGCLPSGETDFVNNLGKNDITFENDYENVTPSGTNAYERKLMYKNGEINKVNI